MIFLEVFQAWDLQGAYCRMRAPARTSREKLIVMGQRVVVKIHAIHALDSIDDAGAHQYHAQPASGA